MPLLQLTDLSGLLAFLRKKGVGNHPVSLRWGGSILRSFIQDPLDSLPACGIGWIGVGESMGESQGKGLLDVPPLQMIPPVPCSPGCGPLQSPPAPSVGLNTGLKDNGNALSDHLAGNLHSGKEVSSCLESASQLDLGLLMGAEESLRVPQEGMSAAVDLGSIFH